MTTQRKNSMEQTFDALRASDERRRSRRSPEQRKIEAAGEMTAGEQAELDAAYAAVADAESGVGGLLVRKGELEALTRDDAEEWTDSGGVFSRLVRKPPDPSRVAAASAELGDHPLKEQVARDQLQITVRTRNHAEKKVSEARARRRYAMEAEYQPARVKPVMRQDPWQQTADRRYRREGQ